MARAGRCLPRAGLRLGDAFELWALLPKGRSLHILAGAQQMRCLSVTFARSAVLTFWGCRSLFVSPAVLRWPALPLLLLERGAAEGWEDRSRPAFVVSPAGKLQCSQPPCCCFWCCEATEQPPGRRQEQGCRLSAPGSCCCPCSGTSLRIALPPSALLLFHCLCDGVGGCVPAPCCCALPGGGYLGKVMEAARLLLRELLLAWALGRCPLQPAGPISQLLACKAWSRSSASHLSHPLCGFLTGKKG